MADPPAAGAGPPSPAAPAATALRPARLVRRAPPALALLLAAAGAAALAVATAGYPTARRWGDALTGDGALELLTPEAYGRLAAWLLAAGLLLVGAAAAVAVRRHALLGSLLAAPTATPRQAVAWGYGIVLGSVLLAAAISGAGFESDLGAMRRLATRTAGADSWQPMHEALRWIADNPGDDLYEELFFTRGVKFQYPVSSLLPLRALAAVDLDGVDALNAINAVLLGTCILGFAALVLRLARAYGPPALTARPGDRLAVAVLGGVTALTFYPLLRAFELGQIQVWLNAAFVLACLALASDRRGLAGTLIGFSSLIKPQMGLFLVWALLRRDWRFAAGWLAVVLPGVVLALGQFGLEPVLGYRRVMAFIAAHGESFHANQSMNGLLHRWFGNGNNLHWEPHAFAPYHRLVHLGTQISGAVLVGIGLLWQRRPTGPRRLQSFIVAALCFTAASPVAWEHHYAVLLPALAVGFVLGVRRLAGGDPASRLVLGCLAAGYVLTANMLHPLDLTWSTPLNPLQSYVFVGALLLLAVLLAVDDGRHRQGLAGTGRP